MPNVKLGSSGFVPRGRSVSVRPMHLLLMGLTVLCTGETATANAQQTTEFPQPGTTEKVTSRRNVVDRIVRARLRDGSTKPPSLLRPGQAHQYDLSLGSTGTIFRAGHKIRVEISSSNFPHYSRNLNTAEDPDFGLTFLIAHQTILHDPQHPSFIELPVHYATTIPLSASAQ